MASSSKHIATLLGFLLLAAEASPLFAQTQEKEEIKLNEDVIKMIQFDFFSGENQYRPLDAPTDKKWMQFKEDLSMPRSMIDSTRVKKIKGYIRAEPYTIWTKFGENPVYDVMPTIEKKWKIHWKLNPFRQYRGEYCKELKPSPGETYLFVNSPVGPSIVAEVDFDKLLYESLTKRGRAIKHNRTHAVAWKKYADYLPTKQDHAGLEKYVIIPNDTLKMEAPELAPAFRPMPVLPVYSIQRADSVQTETPKETKTQPEAVPDYRSIIRQRAAEDSIRRREFLRKDKGKHNVYDVEMQIRRLREQQD